MKKKVIIYGATVTAAAIASVLQSECTVINQGYNCAYEVADSYRTSKITDKPEYSSKTKFVINDLKSRGILKNNGYIHPLPVAGLIASYFMQYNTRVYLASTLEKVTCCDDKVEISFFLNGEKISITADTFIDTTDYGIYDKYIRAALIPNCAAPFLPKNDDLLIRGAFENEYYLQIKADSCDSYNDAAMKLHNVWLSKHKDILRDFSVVSVANELMTVYKKPVFERKNNIIHIPSASFKNLANSFEGGLQCIQKTLLA